MSRVFLDTVGLLALWDADNQWHEAACKAFDDLQNRRIRGATTTYVLLECGNSAARRPFRLSPDRLRQRLEEDGQLLTPTPVEWVEAWENYRRNHAAGAGVVDQVSFIVMRRMGITDAFTNDRHFKSAGFNTLF